MIEKSMKAIYPGTFDPLTNGHLDVITRAAKIFEEVIIAIYDNPKKKPCFTTDERVVLTRDAVKKVNNVTVVKFEQQLMVDFARRIDAHVIIRGLRAISDFESELSYAQANRKLAPDMETIFLMTALEYAFLSSHTVKELASLHADVTDMVPLNIKKALIAKFG